MTNSMSSNPSTLTRAFLVGSGWHLVAGVLVPVAIAAASAALQTRSLTSDLFHMLPLMMAAATGAIFLFHEVVVLLALAYRRHRPPAAEIQAEVAVDLLATVVAADLMLACGLAGFLVWSGQSNKIDQLFLLLGPLAPGLYGVYLLACRVRDALPALPPTGEATGQAALAHIRRSPLLGLRLYVTVCVAVLLFSALGGMQDTGRTLAVAFVSLLAGHLVAMTVQKWRSRGQGPPPA